VEFVTVIQDGIVPPNNIGPRSITSPAGLNSSYNALMAAAIMTTIKGRKYSVDR
jgi:hypothetical protein